MTSSESAIENAKRLLLAFDGQAQIYEQLLAKSEISDLDEQVIATEAAKAQAQAREIQNSVSDVLENWGEISDSVDTELRSRVDAQRRRLQDAILALLSRHELLLENLDQNQTGAGDEAAQLRLLAE